VYSFDPRGGAGRHAVFLEWNLSFSDLGKVPL
jgi:hypothetical protein